MLCLLEAGTCTGQHKLQMIAYILSKRGRAFGKCAAMRRHMRKKSYRLANTEEVQEMQETSNTRNVKGGGGNPLSFRHNVFK